MAIWKWRPNRDFDLSLSSILSRCSNIYLRMSIFKDLKDIFVIPPKFREPGLCFQNILFRFI